METLNKISENKNRQIYYMFCCDDEKKGLNKKIKTDESFKLTELDELNDLLKICNNLHINYDLSIDHWSEEKQELVNQLYIIQNNYKNQ